ncbi:MAG TPA: response regulator, partial [Puia sp.]
AGSIIYFYWLYKSRQTRLQYEVKIAHLSAEKERTEREAERMVNEKEKELNQRRLSFFTNIAHEFRTPLTLIINPVKDLLRRKSQAGDGDNGNDTEKEDLGIVLRNSRRLLSLVDQLLLFRKAESGLDTVHPVKLDFYTLCQEVYLCFVQQAKIKEVQYDFECRQQTIGIVADREKVEIMLYNLLSNALKYVPHGGKVSMKVRSKKEEVEVKISNTGPGIPPEVGDRLFDKFYRVPSKNQAGATGFGIGLYLVKYFAEAHQGTVGYSSEPGGETIFTLKLPKEVAGTAGDQPAGEVQPEVGGLSAGEGLSGGLKEEIALEEEPPMTSEAAATGLKPLVTDKQTILLVDDDVPMRSYIAKIFKNQFTVHEAGSAEEGFALVKELAPDIIISDIQMGGMSGIEFCKMVKQEPASSHIPVILLTGATSSDLKIEGVENGADDYIVKPFEKELLTARVSNLLQSRSNLQKYFFSEITLNQQNLYKISEEHKQFLDKCMRVVEEHLIDDDFSISVLAREMGMSHSAVYKKIKVMSGQSLASFIRMVRLRKAAELFINTTGNVNEVSMLVGINDSKYFREQFNKVFGMNPSEYIRKFRRSFQEQYRVSRDPS